VNNLFLAPRATGLATRARSRTSRATDQCKQGGRHAHAWELWPPDPSPHGARARPAAVDVALGRVRSRKGSARAGEKSRKRAFVLARCDRSAGAEPPAARRRRATRLFFRTGTCPPSHKRTGSESSLSLDEPSPATCAGLHVHAKDLYSQHTAPPACHVITCPCQTAR
jgi:hypothetical protein